MTVGTPWFVSGANHDSDVARVVSYAAFHGQEGVLGTGDCKVTQTTVPGPNIQVSPGVTSIFARGLGNPLQTYANQVEVAEIVPVAPTDASGPRSDLVIMRVEDPAIPGSGWNPASPTDGPFQFVRIVPNVPATTNNVQQVRPGDSAITLARIDIPANTGTITNAMIRDLRSIADLEGERLVVINNPAPPIATSTYFNTKNVPTTKQRRNGTAEFLEKTHNTFRNFPTDALWSVPVPTWAVAADIEAVVWNSKQLVGPVWGESRVKFGSSPNSVFTGVSVFDNDYYGGGSSQQTLFVAGGDVQIPVALRGTVAAVSIETRMYADAATTGRLYSDNGVLLRLSVTFRRTPE